jgi:hypothetical protein
MMKKVKIILLIFFLILTINGISQVENKIDSVIPLKYYLGINIGILNNFHSALIDGKNFNNYSNSISIGENFTMPLSKRWELTVQSNVQIGARVKNNYDTKGESFSYELYRTVIDLPIIFRYMLNNNKKPVGLSPHFIQFGPVFSYNLMANKTIRFNQYGNNSSLRSTYPGFENGYNNRFRIGTGYTFRLKYSFIRAELNYDYDFNSLNKNTLPIGNLTKVTNDALGINFVLESRSKFIHNKVKKVKIGRIK